MKIAEVVPNKKIVWEVLDSRQDWLKDPAEWVGTRIAWEISSQARGTRVDMTHLGLLAEVECYDQCKMGWDFFIPKSLTKLLNEGKGLPA